MEERKFILLLIPKLKLLRFVILIFAEPQVCLQKEFDAITDELLVRKWRRGAHKIGTTENSSDWEYEIGEPPYLKNSLIQENMLSESSENVCIIASP